MIRANPPIPDPIYLASIFWPHITFYRKQKEIIYSVWNNDETVVPAGTELGKDFIAGRLAILFFMSRHPCRICTSSTTDYHLDVLWGEIEQCIQDSRTPLDTKDGGNLVVGHRHIRKIVDGRECPISMIKGIVPAPGKEAALQGFHVDSSDGIARNMWICDEASGANDAMKKVASGWAKRMFIFGNPWECTNFFYKAVEGDVVSGVPGGDIPDEDEPDRYLRKVIHICAEDSPNVAYGLLEEQQGKPPSFQYLIPGVVGYKDYKKHRRLWDPIEQCVKLDGRFYRGKELKLYPQEYLRMAIEKARELGIGRKCKYIGVDPGEGMAYTVWTGGDDLGFIKQVKLKTPDTSVIIDYTIGFMREWGVSPERVLFDRGGGGLQLACELRKKGYNVRTVGFGESATAEKKRGTTPLERRKQEEEHRYAYLTRRAEMYGELAIAIDPSDGNVYGIPREMSDLHYQMSLIPKKYKEGRLWLPPKDKPPTNDKSTVITMKDLIGRSPDELDSAVLCHFARIDRVYHARAGAI